MLRTTPFVKFKHWSEIANITVTANLASKNLPSCQLFLWQWVPCLSQKPGWYRSHHAGTRFNHGLEGVVVGWILQLLGKVTFEMGASGMDHFMTSRCQWDPSFRNKYNKSPHGRRRFALEVGNQGLQQHQAGTDYWHMFFERWGESVGMVHCLCFFLSGL